MNDRAINDKTKLIAAQKDENVVDVRYLTESQLKSLGVSQMAYVKTILINGDVVFAIHAADGTPMAVTDNVKTAFAAVVQQEMIPSLVN
ncbi:hypothetical protein CIN_10360 [Commensalibacter intestini A911]|uniref:DUF1150 family protein n=1 Tax=Commensalibacter intestini A911 TaxID=1088868 RepID=G6F0N3_9PROT|nr:DUF1150 family protein [Commensalibacter intestini]EHD13677.1 hypothetical protein CIN_10360 [Commensalibacter intestini A911]